MYFLNIGEKYLGEVLIVDFGMEGGGIKEDKYYFPIYKVQKDETVTKKINFLDKYK